MRHKNVVITILAVICAIGMTMCMTGCSFPKLAPSKASDTTLTPSVSDSNLITAGTLTIGLDYSYAPFAGESDGRVVGIDADVGAALAQKLGLKAEFVDVGTGGGPNAVANKKCDVFLSFEKNDSTNSIAAYAGTYMYDAASLFTVSSSSTSSNASYTTASGQKIAAQKGRATAELVKSLYGSTSLVEENNLVDAFSALENGTVKYAAASGVVGSYIATSYSDIKFYCSLENPREIGAGVASSNTTLKSKVSSALSSLSQDGTINIIISKWIGAPLNLSTVTTTTTTTTSGSTTTVASPTPSPTAEATPTTSDTTPTPTPTTAG